MARVIIRKDFAEEIITRVNEKTESLLDTISILSKKVNEAKSVYTSDNSSSTSIDAMSETINKIISSYSELNRKFSQALRANIDEYSRSDQKIASNLKAVTSVPLVAGSLTDSSIMGRTANSATNANAEKFLNEEQLSKAFFEKEGNYTFEYRNDGSVKINRDGQPLAFTDKKTADWFFENSYSQPKGNNSKTLNAWNDGKERKINRTYETFEENAAYEAGKADRNRENNEMYDYGAHRTDNRDPDFQKRIDELNFSNMSADDLKMYEQGIRDAAVNETAAAEASKHYREEIAKAQTSTFATNIANARTRKKTKP